MRATYAEASFSGEFSATRPPRCDTNAGSVFADFLFNGAGAAVDRLASYAFVGRTKRARARSSAESLGPAERERALAAIASTWDPATLDDDRLFPRSPAIDPKLARVRALSGGDVVDASWASAFTPIDDAVTERYAARAENARAAVRLFLHHEPRPAAVLVHGYRAGRFSFEERAWPVSWLFERGLDVALFTLPGHGARGRGDGGAPFWPSSDPRVTNEGFRQAMFDLGALVDHLHARGAPSVGVMGMSLGGYTTALAATVERGLSFAMPIIPLASLPDVAREGDRYVGTPEEQRTQHELLERAHLAVSPLARAPLIDPSRTLVVAATGDRITPVAHARKLAAHLGAPIVELAGGHLLQMWRGEAFRQVGRLLGGLGLLAERQR
jgi:pimeloyl-ACP methyl ester carboxylesterase